MKRSKLRELIVKSRTYRRFYQDTRINRSTLRRLVDLARLSPSGGNMQPLKYCLSCEPKRNSLIFSCLSWAGYLRDWPGPVEGERPSGYIVILGDTTILQNIGCNHGIAAQSIMLGAVEMGLGGCIFGSINRTRLQKLLNIPDRCEILLVLALGKPKEKVFLETVKRGNIKYWRDSEGGHHVPKRSLNDIIIG